MNTHTIPYSSEVYPVNVVGDQEHRLLNEIENLIRETFGLWDQVRVGFSWRHYYFNHTQRVRALSRTIGRKEGADLRTLEYAALLHDITKRYDGGMVTDKEGNRVVDQEGFWRNEQILPTRSNRITELYAAHTQFHTLHHRSGALIARELLREYGFEEAFCRAVASTIEAHLKPRDMDEAQKQRLYRTIESQVLHDADMIDSNLGLIALYRNVQIHAGRMIQQDSEVDLQRYVETLPRWLGMKESFLSQMMTETGRRIGETRQQRNVEIYRQVTEEMTEDHAGVHLQFGLVGVFQYFMDGADDPDLHAHMEHLRTVWIPERKRRLLARAEGKQATRALLRTAQFCKWMDEEIQEIAHMGDGE